ncbi:MAG: LCP family protein [Merdimonas faecis]|uniref:LCP family protein n=1 Tax=Merdimonas faecis TaxID=1653435 RepID=UPI003990C541
MNKKKKKNYQISRAERKKLIKRRRRKRMILLVVEVIILAVLSVVAYGVFKLGKLDFNILDERNLEAYKDTGPYTNIALFGLDSRNDELEGGVQSDSIMIASINNETSEVKLISVYRDTLLKQKDGTYEKANSAYNVGGPEDAISMLNRNFDLDIKNYISVNFSALIKAIDALGGIELDMTEEEADWCYRYAMDTAEIAGVECGDFEVKAGKQHVDGVHAVAYARIRYTEGNDFKRTERQREVLEKTAQKAKEADFLTLNQIVDEVFPLISTSFSMQDLLGFAANALDYTIVETSGFPYQVTTSENVISHTGSYVVPIGFTDNVTKLHGALFEDSAYQPSETVQQINDDIIYLTGVTEDTEALQTTFDEDIQNEESQ